MKTTSTMAVLFVAGLSLSINACRWSNKKNSNTKGSGETKTEQTTPSETTKVEQEPVDVKVTTVEQVEAEQGEVVLCSEATLSQLQAISTSQNEFAARVESCRGDSRALESLLDHLDTATILVNDFENDHGNGVCYEQVEKDATLREYNLGSFVSRFRSHIAMLTGRINRYLADARNTSNQSQDQGDAEQSQNAPSQQLPY